MRTKVVTYQLQMMLSKKPIDGKAEIKRRKDETRSKRHRQGRIRHRPKILYKT